MCEACKELTLVKENLKIDTIYGSKTGYFQPIENINIKYCPVCGRKLNAEPIEEERLQNE